MIQQKRLKGKLKGLYVKSRTVCLNKNTVDFTQQGHHLAKLLSPLSRSQYTVSSTKEFINMIKNETVPNAYKMLSFDVSSLFTMLSLDYAIDLIETNLWQ